MQIGLIGLPYSGKTTLFQTLTQIHQTSSGKDTSNQAIVKVPDARLDKLTEMFNPKKKVNATIEIVDVVSVSKNEKASMFNSQFMGKVKTNDALIHIVRNFNDDAVPHIDGSVDALRDIATLNDELLLNDLAFVENRLEKLDKDLMKQKNKNEVQTEISVMQRWHSLLSNNIPLRKGDIPVDERKFFANYQPLTAKPLLLAVNMSEDNVKDADAIVNKIKSNITGSSVAVEPFFAKLELELAMLDEDERAVFMSDYGLTESPLNRMLRSVYEMCGLNCFFTVGEDECRAWTIHKGDTAQVAAGVIHTDFYNKFIRAEVVSYADFIANGSLNKCKEVGCLRLEGKDYICTDGDILNIRHG